MLRVPPKRRKKYSSISMPGFRLGLNTVLEENLISNEEASELINFKLSEAGKTRGGLVTRDPIVVETDFAVDSNAAVVVYDRAPISGTDRIIMVDENGLVYYNDAGTPTQIGSLVLESGSVTATPFMGAMILFDGGYIKYLDGVTSVKLAYDSGTGTSGYQFDNSDGDNDTTITLGDGTNIRVAYKFTSQAWTAGYKIPITTITVYLSKSGTPSATAITAKLRAVSDDSILASKELLADATTLTGTAAATSVTFASTDITTEMSPSTAYYMTLEHAGGSPGNCVNVHCTTVASGGTGYHYIAAWAADATKTPLMSLQPGMPPKADYGVVHNGRLWTFSESVKPGMSNFSNRSYKDFSTPDYAGYLGAVDDDENTFPIGGILSLYGELWFYGKQSQPYLAKLVGDTPDEYKINKIYQKAWTTQRTLIGTGNDGWSGSGDGVDTLSGVNEFGDVRTFSVSDPVGDRIREYWDSDTAFAGYYPTDGQYVLCMPEYHRLMIGHTKQNTTDSNGNTRYPWSEYELYLHDLTDENYYEWTNASGSVWYVEAAGGGDPGFISKPDALVALGDRRLNNQTVYANLVSAEWYFGDQDGLGFDTVYFYNTSSDSPIDSGTTLRTAIIPTCFGYFGGEFYFGSGNGFVYKFDPSEYKDQTTIQIKPSTATAQIEVPFNKICLEEFQIGMGSKGGGVVTVEIYRDNNIATPIISFDMIINVSSTMLVQDAIMEVQDALFLVSDSTSSTFSRGININCNAFKVRISEIKNAGYPVYVNGYTIKYRGLSI